MGGNIQRFFIGERTLGGINHHKDHLADLGTELHQIENKFRVMIKLGQNNRMRNPR